MLEAVTHQLEMMHFVTVKNVGGITHEESIVRPSGGGNPANWILGHIVATRDALLPALGEQPVLGDRRKLYARGSKPGDETVAFEELVAAFEASQQRLLAGLARVTEEQLAGPAPFSPGGEPETLGSLLNGIMFHDAYHGGQLGIVRRLLGKEGAVK